MRIKLVFFLGLISAWMLASCSLPVKPPAEFLGTPSLPAYQTVAALLTETARVNAGLTAESTAAPIIQETPQPAPTQSPNPQSSAEASPTAFEASLSTGTPELFCDLAQAGRPIDVTIPDDTKVQAGQLFTKTWRLVNAGSCSWTREYSVVWFSGDDLGIRREEFLRATVLPGQSVDLSVDMAAPVSGGIYQSNWKIRNPTGGLFGIGPGGGAPFWVRVEVIQLATATPSPTPTSASSATPTAVVLNEGSVTLLAPQAFDLESGVADTITEDDLALVIVDSNLRLEPVNGAELVVFGPGLPGLADCLAARTTSEGIQLGGELAGNYLCVRTNQGLAAYVKLTRIDATGSEVDLDFVTWAE